MTAAAASVDIGVLLAGVAAIISALAVLVTAFRTNRKIEQVRDEVRTFNETAIGPLASADETRRIEEIPRPERTAKEQRHVDDAPAPDPPQGAGR